MKPRLKLVMSLFNLTLKRLFSKKLTSILLILSIGLSSMLLMGVQKIKESAKTSFSQSISGTDLIVGARSGDTQLLLYTVFRQGHPVANMSWDSVRSIQAFSEVAWVVPISLGDSHHGYPVLGTTADYFQHYRYAKKQTLRFHKGDYFRDTFEVVLGSEIAKTLNYQLNDRLFLAHGIAKSNLRLHKDQSFRVVGILKPTGTPIDKTLHIPLEGFTALHTKGGYSSNKPSLHSHNLTPQSVTSCLVGLKSKFSIFSVQNRITSWKSEPLMAIIPGVSLSRLWNSIRTVDTAFLVITILVTLITFIGLLLVLLISLQQSKRELAILRTMGAHPLQLSWLLMLESIFITVSGVIVGIWLVNVLGYILKPILEVKMGLILSFSMISLTELYLALGIIFFGIITSFIPALLAYRKSLSEGFVSI